MDADHQRAWTTALARFDMTLLLDGGRPIWSGRVAGNVLTVRLDDRGDVTASVTGEAPDSGGFFATPRSAFLTPGEALETGDPVFDARVVVLPLDLWALARLDADTRDLLRAVVALDGGVSPREVWIGPRAPDRWGDSDAIVAALRLVSRLFARLHAPLAEPAARLADLADDDPLFTVRSRAQELLRSPPRLRSAIEVADRSAEAFIRLHRAALDSRGDEDRETALRRLLDLFGCEPALDTLDAYPGPWTDAVERAVVQTLGANLPEGVLVRLMGHEHVGVACQSWALENAPGGWSLDAIARVLESPDEGLRRSAIGRLLVLEPWEQVREVLAAAPGPFTDRHFEAIRRRLKGGGTDADVALLVKMGERRPKTVGTTTELARAFGATRRPTARDALAALARSASRREAPLVGLWACGASFEEVHRWQPDLLREAAPAEPLAHLLAELHVQRPGRLGVFLGGLLQQTTVGDGPKQHLLLDALSKLGDVAAVPALQVMLDESEFDALKAKAATAIGEIGDIGAIELLLPFTRGLLRSGLVKGAARAAIARIRERLGLDGEAGALSLTDKREGDLSLVDPDEA